jgi:kinesin family protein 6/9
MLSREAVRVVARSRPAESGCCDMVSVGPEGRTINVRQTAPTVAGSAKQENVSFSCDSVLVGASQERSFEVVGQPLCEAVLQGYNGTALAYGQTGAGKSFSVIGAGAGDYHQRGLLPRSIACIFREVGNRPEFNFKARFSCLEIYNESMYDLLSTLPGAGRTELSISETKGARRALSSRRLSPPCPPASRPAPPPR